MSDDRAIVSTADFITPVVDDPRTFGRVAAANSISDVYAMGGTPLMALNLLGFPPAGLSNEVLGEILAGAGEVCAEANCAVAGGHTVRDEEVKFGLSVTGEVHPDKILRNSTAQVGDLLLLTKPLGTGALIAAQKKGRLDEEQYEALVTCMTTLNTCGALMFDLGATACTDVTGFGLTGHALEMAKGSGVTLHIDTSTLPLLPEAVALCGEGFTCGGTKSNAAFTGGDIAYAESIGQDMIGLLNDPQTSGGLLISAPADKMPALVKAAEASGTLCASVIGKAVKKSSNGPYISFHS
ncbi:MAG: selenium donor protein [Candidatus Krumholzibacteriia bacterium]